MSHVITDMESTRTGRISAEGDHSQVLSSAVSWPAIFAGAAGAAALSLILLVLGTGLGFSAISPWAMNGINATTFGFATILWLSFTQLAASGMGGYLAGRLRTRWTAVHIDEVYFRDTAHGFLAWAVATLLTAALLTSVVGAIVSGGVSVGAAVADGVAGSAAVVATSAADSDEGSHTMDYYVDTLFRNDAAGMAQQAREGSGIPTGEIARIFVRALRTGNLPPQDARHIAQLVAQHTGMRPQEAEQRVSQTFDDVRTALEEAETTAREVADEARKASAFTALWMFISLLMGAFVASLMAVFGGRQRDA